MRIITVLLLTICLYSCQTQTTETEFNLISYNIRFNNPDDGINAWPNRKIWVADLLRFYDADIVCVQEALHHQLEDLLEQLPQFRYSGIGRDDGKQAGEYSAILYNQNRFTLLDEGTFWLSPTPETPSMGWDAAVIRICSWVKFNDILSGQSFYVFNTHFDHVGVQAREESARLIIRSMEETAGEFPVIIAGDINAEPNDLAVQTITARLHDAYKASREPAYGPYGTWNAFDYNSPLDRRIDFVFVNDKIEVLKYAALSDAKNQRFPSDHLPVFVRLGLKE
jgi:endonuclease/exonuclease/phosphatase family metal-dependent hydrolase